MAYAGKLARADRAFVAATAEVVGRIWRLATGFLAVAAAFVRRDLFFFDPATTAEVEATGDLGRAWNAGCDSGRTFLGTIAAGRRLRLADLLRPVRAAGAGQPTGAALALLPLRFFPVPPVAPAVTPCLNMPVRLMAGPFFAAIAEAALGGAARVGRSGVIVAAGRGRDAATVESPGRRERNEDEMVCDEWGRRRNFDRRVDPGRWPELCSRPRTPRSTGRLRESVDSLHNESDVESAVVSPSASGSNQELGSSAAAH